MMSYLTGIITHIGQPNELSLVLKPPNQFAVEKQTLWKLDL